MYRAELLGNGFISVFCYASKMYYLLDMYTLKFHSCAPCEPYRSAIVAEAKKVQPPIKVIS
jgi:hypothetical protein